jgi:hypothetical protein
MKLFTMENLFLLLKNTVMNILYTNTAALFDLRKENFENLSQISIKNTFYIFKNKTRGKVFRRRTIFSATFLNNPINFVRGE